MAVGPSCRKVSIWTRSLHCRMLHTCMTNTPSHGCTFVEGKRVRGFFVLFRKRCSSPRMLDRNAVSDMLNQVCLFPIQLFSDKIKAHSHLPLFKNTLISGIIIPSGIISYLKYWFCHRSAREHFRGTNSALTLRHEHVHQLMQTDSSDCRTDSCAVFLFMTL